VRLFFALCPPPAVAEQLAGIADSCAKKFGGKPSRQETIHMTLVFLGEVPDERLPLLIQRAKMIKATPFVINIDCLGYWSHNHLLWAGNSSPSQPLGELVGNLRIALSQAGFAFDGEKNTLTSHLTLVRKIARASAPSGLVAIDSISWCCSSFALVHSRLSTDGSAYKTICEFPCAG
jgi:2'-5' RNA ligase